jgi:probable F420-dependent oxidoreductase
MELGRVGVWSGEARRRELSEVAEMAAAAETLGYGALWIPGGAGGDILDRCEVALRATTTLVVATGIVNIWRHDAAEVAATTSALNDELDGRFLLGLGVSHERLIREEYVAPYTKMKSYLDELEAAGQGPEQLALAALRPKMLKLSAERSLGAHPYFVPVEHTPVARAALGDSALLMPEVAVLIETDPDVARSKAREFCSLYLGLPNYTNNLRDLGYTESDLEGSGSDRLIDAIVAWGSPEHIAERVAAHHDAGADHVCVQVIGDPDGSPVDSWTQLASVLL